MANRQEFPDRPLLGEWALVALLGVSLTWTTLCLGGYRPETMVVTSLLNGALLVLMLVEQARTGRRLHPAGWFLLPFLVYAAANAAFHTPVPWLGWHDWLGWAQATAIFWVVLNGVGSRTTQAVLGGWIAALGVVAVILALYQRLVDPEWLMLGRTQVVHFIGRSSGPFGIPNSLAALLLLVLLPSLGLTLSPGAGRGLRVLGGVLSLIYGVGLFLTVSRGALLSLLLVLVAWPLLRAGGGWARRVAVSLAVLAGLGLLGGLLYRGSPEVKVRFDRLVADHGERSRPIMWRAAWGIFTEDPLWGGGAGGYNILMERYRPENFQDDSQWAHNDYLNTLCDYGVAGFVLAFGSWSLIAGTAARKGRGQDPGLRRMDGAIGLGLLAFLLQLAVDFHFKIPALGMTFAAVAALLVRRRWPTGGGPSSSATRWTLAGASLLAVLVTLSWVLPHYRAEALRYGNRRNIDALALREPDDANDLILLRNARTDFAEATRIDASNSQAWADLSYVDALISRLEPDRRAELAERAEAAARSALAGTPVIAEHWIRLGVALDMEGHWAEAGEAFGEALRLAPNRANPWYHQAYHFSLKPSYHLVAVAAVAMSLRLDPSAREAQQLRDELAAAAAPKSSPTGD